MTEEKKTGSAGFTSSYDSEVKAGYEKLKKRPAFIYEASADPAYRAYRDSYRREGERAMKNSVAQAADLTGGYGSSYAQSVGQQQYGEYLRKLSDLMPELYSQAYGRYKAEGEILNQELANAQKLADMEYERHRDETARADAKEQFDYKKKQDAFKNLADIISATGYVPTEEELSESGMSAELANALSYEFMRVNGLLPGEEADEGGGTNYYNLSPTSPFDIGYREGMFNRESAKLGGN